MKKPRCMLDAMTDAIGPSSEEARLLSALDAEIDPMVTSNGPVTDQLLFHYTDAHGFAEIVQKQELWATHFRYLNDSKEVLHGEEIIEDEARKLAQKEEDGLPSAFAHDLVQLYSSYRLSEKADIFIASLSEEGDQLSQWRGYGGRGAGYALGFSHSQRAVAEPGDERYATVIYRCSYDEATFRSRVSKIVHDAAVSLFKYGVQFKTEEGKKRALATAMASLLRKLAPESSFLKHHSFREEAEWRIVAMSLPTARTTFPEFRQANVALVPFSRLPLNCDRGHGCLTLKKVVVGPAADFSRASLAARMLVSKHGYDPDIVVRSEIAFRG